MKLSTFLVLECLLEIGVAGAVITAAGASQTGSDPTLLIGLAVMLLAAALAVRTYRTAARAHRRETSA